MFLPTESKSLLGNFSTALDPHAIIAVLAILLLAVSFALGIARLRPIHKQRSRNQVARMPPGPNEQIIFGNLRQFFKARDAGGLVPYYAPFNSGDWPQLDSLAQYGDMTTLSMGAQTWVMLNSDESISAIIDKNGRITAERPEMPVAGGLVSHDLRTVIRRTAPWTEGRRVMHHLFSGHTLKLYGPWQELESSVLLSHILEDPTQWHAHIYRYSTAVYYRMVMGFRLDKSRAELDEFQQVAMEFIWSVFRSPIDFFPQLTRWVPELLQPWRPFWERMGYRHKEVSDKWWQPVRKAVMEGTANASFVRDTLLSPDVKYHGNEGEAMYLATSVIAAGADNTRMTLNVFMMAMISHPETLQRARVELDSLCGTPESQNFRLPGVDDIGSLPYLSALVKEVLRWRPTVPLSPPHELIEDLEYNGYTFPKGTNFIINVIAASRAVNEPDKFLPDRFLDGNQDNVTHGIWVFGGGRRICVGYRVAQQALFVAMARLIFCFNISPRGDFNTQKLNHLTIHEPFPVLIESRGSLYDELVKTEAHRA